MFQFNEIGDSVARSAIKRSSNAKLLLPLKLLVVSYET